MKHMIVGLASALFLLTGAVAGAQTFAVEAESVNQGRLAKKAAALLDQIRADGIVGVAQRTWQPAELGLLELLTQFEHEFEGADEARRLVSARLKSLPSGGITVAPHAAPQAGLAQEYLVHVLNASNNIFDEIVVFFNRVGQPGVYILNVFDVQPGALPIFGLGGCSWMNSYVVGGFIGDDLRAKIPMTDGVMTAARASKENPLDHSPCADYWGFR